MVVVMSPTSYETPEAPLDLSSGANQAGSQESYISSVRLSPNRVNQDCDYGMRDFFPVFTVSPYNDVNVQCVSPVSIPDSPAAPTLGSLLDEATGMYGSIIRRPATSLSISDQVEQLHLLSEPLIPLPVMVRPDDGPERGPASEVVPPPAVFSREGPLDASTEPAAIGDHPLILVGLSGCPYWMTTYRDCDLACVDTSFGVQIYHPRFLECVEAPESARLLGRPPVE